MRRATTSAVLELAQALGEDVGAQDSEAGAQVGEALRAEQQLAHDEQGPALADEVERAGDPAAVAVGALAGTGILSSRSSFGLHDLVSWYFQSYDTVQQLAIEGGEMSERDTYPHGVPCWVEALVPDPRGRDRLLCEVFGWEFDGPGKMPDEPPSEYFVARMRGRDVAGIGSRPTARRPGLDHPRPHGQRRRHRRGGRGRGRDRGREPFDVPPVGRMAVLADPAGARFAPGRRTAARARSSSTSRARGR